MCGTMCLDSLDDSLMLKDPKITGNPPGYITMLCSGALQDVCKCHYREKTDNHPEVIEM